MLKQGVSQNLLRFCHWRTGPALALAASLLCLVLYARVASRRSRRRLRLPPGPKPLPLVGNLFDIPKTMSPHDFHAISQKYGDVACLNALGQTIIVLGSYEAASELLDKRSANYSDRASSAMARLIGVDWEMVLLPYGPRWRRRRKDFHQFFNTGAVTQFRPVQVRETRRALRRLVSAPDEFMDHMRFAFGSTIMEIGYGLKITDKDDRFLAVEEEGLKIFLKAFVPGKYLVETLPFLRHIPDWMPGAQFKRDAAQWKMTAQAMRNLPFGAALESMRKGPHSSSIASKLIERAQTVGSEEEWDVARDVVGVVYAAGVDTVLGAMQIFFLAMVTYQEVQQKAQAVLDAVVGPERLPEFSDREALPYIEALILECLRWKVTVPLSMPHSSLEDDEYDGYFIPGGSLIIPNSWAFAHDPEQYPDPDQFNPDRFIKDGKLASDVLDPRNYAFGYGRRICPGRHFAEATMFIAIASVLHTLNIHPPLDEKGVAYVPEGKMVIGCLSTLEPFECRISPRSPSAMGLIFADEPENE